MHWGEYVSYIYSAVVNLYATNATFDDIHYYHDSIHYIHMLLYYSDSGKIWLLPSPNTEVSIYRKWEKIRWV